MFPVESQNNQVSDNFINAINQLDLVNMQELSLLLGKLTLLIQFYETKLKIRNRNFDENEFLRVTRKLRVIKTLAKCIIGIFKTTLALIDTGADQNCIQEGLIPTKYYQKTSEKLSSANGSKLIIRYKLPKVKICNKGYCYKTYLILVKNLNSGVILGTPFITMLYPFTVCDNGIQTQILGKTILFEFVFPIIPKGIGSIENNINLIENKQKQIKFLIDEITEKRIEEQLSDIYFFL